MQNEFCCVNLVSSNWRTRNTNQVAPTYLSSASTSKDVMNNQPHDNPHQPPEVEYSQDVIVDFGPFL